MTVEVALRHRFGGFSLDAAFVAQDRGVVALFGPSGAGKTSIANAIAGLFRPQEGRIAVAGAALFDSRTGLFVPTRLRRIGYVFQEPRLFPHMSVATNLRFGLRRAPELAPAGAFDDTVALLGLEPLLDRGPAKLSGGEKSRVALGRALLSNPRLLILDEPLAALDAARKAEILPWLVRLRDDAKMPMVYVTHALDEVAQLADSVVLLRDGRVAAQGPTFDLLPDLDFAAQAGVAPLGAVIAATVAGDSCGLTELRFSGGSLFVPRLSAHAGRTVRVRLRAEDVLLAKAPPHDISANNVLPAVVSALRDADETHSDVQLDCGGVKIVARITRASRLRLGIAAGMALYAVVKSVAVDSR